MGVVGAHAALGRHPRVPEGVAARDLVEPIALDEIRGWPASL